MTERDERMPEWRLGTAGPGVGEMTLIHVLFTVTADMPRSKFYNQEGIVGRNMGESAAWLASAWVQ